MSPFPGSPSDIDRSPETSDHDSADRVDSLVAWINEIDSRLRVAEVATGDEKAAKELRKAVEAAAKHDPKLEERLGNRVDVLADRLATLATTVSTTAAALARKDGEIAALQRDLEDGKTRIDAALGQTRQSTSTAEVDELRKTVSRISEQKLPKNVDGRIDDLKSTLGVLGQRLETLSSTVSTTASGLAGREGEVVALRRRLEDEHTGVEAEVAKLRAAIDPAPVAELRAAVKTLSDGTRALERDGQRRHDAVKSALESIVQRIDALTVAVAGATRDVASGEGEVTALRTAFEEESSRVDSLLVKLHRATGELSARVAELGGLAASDTVDELGERLAELSARVEALGTTVKETAAGYADKEYEIAALGRRFEEISAQVDAGVRDLRDAVGLMAEQGRDPELEKRVEGLASGLEERVEGLASELEERVEGLASELAARIAELVLRLDAAESADLRDTRVDELLGDVRSLAGRLTSIEGRTSTGRDEALAAVVSLEQRLTEITQQLEQDRRDHALGASQVAQAVQAAEAWAQERASLEEASSALASRIVELGQRLDAAEATDIRDTRVDGLLGEVSSLAERLTEIDAATLTDSDESAAAVASLERRIAEMGTALTDSAATIASLQEAIRASAEGSAEREEDVQALSERFHDASARVDALVGELRTALETMPAPVSAEAVEQRLGELAARLEDVEQSRATAALEIARASASWSDERASIRDDLASFAQTSSGSAEEHAAVQQRLEALAEAVAGLESRPPTVDVAGDERVPEIVEKLEEMERGREALAAEIAGATAFWSSGLGALEARLAEVAATKEEEGARKVDDEVVRALFDLARRLDAVERGHAAGDAEVVRAAESWAAERDFLAAGLDELTRRLDSLDAGGASADSASAPLGDTSDGRFRLELRALELRMEHAEAASRENREAVLVQLERLATRIEWRLQRLETGNVDDPLPQVANGPLAQVVPLHGSEA